MVDIELASLSKWAEKKVAEEQEREKLTKLLCDVMETDGCSGHCNSPPCYRVENAVDNLIANGVTVQEWIPVKDRLPEVRVPVLTYGRKGAIGIGFVQPTSVVADGKVYFYARYGDSLPTHWMPLPQPPKGE